MPNYRRLYIPGGSYFFTVVTEQRRPILCDAPMRAALRNAITSVRRKHPFRIEGMVLLPDHLHMIWTLPEGDSNYPLRVRLVKTHMTKGLRRVMAAPLLGVRAALRGRLQTPPRLPALEPGQARAGAART
jgi:putative transposase